MLGSSNEKYDWQNITTLKLFVVVYHFIPEVGEDEQCNSQRYDGCDEADEVDET